MCGDHAVEHVQGFIFWDQTLRLGQYSALCASFPYKGGVYNGAQLANFPRWRVIFPVPLGPTADFDLPSTHRLPPMWGGTWYSLWQQRAPEEDWTNTAPSVRASHTRGGAKNGGQLAEFPRWRVVFLRAVPLHLSELPPQGDLETAGQRSSTSPASRDGHPRWPPPRAIVALRLDIRKKRPLSSHKSPRKSSTFVTRLHVRCRSSSPNTCRATAR